MVSYNFFFLPSFSFLSAFKTSGFLSSIITPDAAFVLPRRQKLHRSLLWLASSHFLPFFFRLCQLRFLEKHQPIFPAKFPFRNSGKCSVPLIEENKLRCGWLSKCLAAGELSGEPLIKWPTARWVSVKRGVGVGVGVIFFLYFFPFSLFFSFFFPTSEVVRGQIRIKANIKKLSL